VEEHSWYQGHHKETYETTLRQVFFGIELSRNKIATAKFNSKFELNKRIYLGPTSTDNDLAFLMCNQALVSSGSLVIDPFVGTGGLLIPAASKGAITFGSDLDIRVINGYAVGRINKKSPYYSAEKKF
jgi:tRNA G10  N-methylase Trm11